ncbi:MAG TPA: hypothetical protein VN458_09465 [Solirubrobacterales bacterium]|nr:hypothetical protein [Solirubrobacterales bacterium]
MGGTGIASKRPFKLAAAAIAIIGVVGLGALQADGRLIERTKSVRVPVDTGPGGTASAKARCPEGKRVVLGGFEVSLRADDGYSTHLKLDGRRGWRAGAVNYDADERPTLTSIAYCSRLRGIKAREHTVRIPKQGPTDSPVTVTARCHPGEQLAFGGFDYDQGAVPGESSDAYVSELRRTGKHGWRVGAFNFAHSAPVTAIAYCSKHAPRTTTEKKTVTVESNDVARVKAKCGRDKRVAFGGYRADVTFNDAFVSLHGLERTSARVWKVSAFNTNGTDAGQLTAYAYCAGG